MEGTHHREMKLSPVPIVEELRAKISGTEMAPAALFVLDGCRALGHVPGLRDLARDYRRLLTYNFVPAGSGLLKDFRYGT